MPPGPEHALAAALRPAAGPAQRVRVLVAGATGATGEAVLARLAASPRIGHIGLLLRQPVTVALRHVQGVVVSPDGPAGWPPQAADEGVVMFDPPRLFHGREKALWHVEPGQLPGIAAWMKASGVRRLLIVMPHAQGRLPEAVKHGLASMDEQAVTALGFDTVLIVRSAQPPGRVSGRSAPQRLAAAMLGVLHHLVPAREKPVRVQRVAEFAEAALALAPEGIHIAAPALVWDAAQGDTRARVARWLQPDAASRHNAG